MVALLPQRNVHEDRDSDWVQHEEEGRIDAGEGIPRWADYSIVVLEEPQIHVTIERPHSRNTHRRIHGEEHEHD